MNESTDRFREYRERESRIAKNLKAEGYCNFDIGVVSKILPIRAERPLFDREHSEDASYVDFRELPGDRIVYVGATHPSAEYLIRVDQGGDEKWLQIWIANPLRGNGWCFECPLDEFPRSFLSYRDETGPKPLSLRVGSQTTFPYFSYFEGSLMLDPNNLDWRDTPQKIKIGTEKRPKSTTTI